MLLGQPIAFLSKMLNGNASLLSTYERELLALVTAMQKWGSCLLDQSFVIKTSQQALKFLLEQRVGTEWLTKLIRYVFKIEYIKERKNRVADALLRKGDEEKEVKGVLALITFPNPEWVDELKLSYKFSPEFAELLHKVEKIFEVPKGVKM